MMDIAPINSSSPAMDETNYPLYIRSHGKEKASLLFCIAMFNQLLVACLNEALETRGKVHPQAIMEFYRRFGLGECEVQSKIYLRFFFETGLFTGDYGIYVIHCVEKVQRPGHLYTHMFLILAQPRLNMQELNTDNGVEEFFTSVVKQQPAAYIIDPYFNFIGVVADWASSLPYQGMQEDKINAVYDVLEIGPEILSKELYNTSEELADQFIQETLFISDDNRNAVLAIAYRYQYKYPTFPDQLRAAIVFARILLQMKCKMSKFDPHLALRKCIVAGTGEDVRVLLKIFGADPNEQGAKSGQTAFQRLMAMRTGKDLPQKRALLGIVDAVPAPLLDPTAAASSAAAAPSPPAPILFAVSPSAAALSTPGEQLLPKSLPLVQKITILMSIFVLIIALITQIID